MEIEKHRPLFNIIDDLQSQFLNLIAGLQSELFKARKEIKELKEKLMQAKSKEEKELEDAFEE